MRPREGDGGHGSIIAGDVSFKDLVMAAGGGRLDPSFPKLDLVDFSDRLSGRFQADVPHMPGRVRTR